ncbi:MAG: helix-turn-helix domain-containing protein [Clostridium sp.]
MRNYIREINEEKLIIQSSSNGYWITVLDSPCNKRKIESSLVYDFSSQNERLLYIAERIITSSEEADLYDIADDIYISYSTIEKDLIQIRGIIKDFHLTLLRGNGKPPSKVVKRASVLLYAICFLNKILQLCKIRSMPYVKIYIFPSIRLRI